MAPSLTYTEFLGAKGNYRLYYCRLTIKQWFLSTRGFYTPRDTKQCLEVFFLVTTWGGGGGYWKSSGQKSGMLLNILQCTGEITKAPQ